MQDSVAYRSNSRAWKMYVKVQFAALESLAYWIGIGQRVQHQATIVSTSTFIRTEWQSVPDLGIFH